MKVFLKKNQTWSSLNFWKCCYYRPTIDFHEDLTFMYSLMLSITNVSFVLICTIPPSYVNVYYKAGDFIGQSSPVNVVDTISLTNSWQWRLAQMISNFITLSNKKGETGGAETVHLSASSEYTPIIQRDSCCSGLWIIVCPLSFFCFVVALSVLLWFNATIPSNFCG